MSQPVVELREVSFRYETRWAISNINLEITQGEYVGLIGPNGGGKTTTLKLILGLLKATEGEVRVFDRPALRLSRRERSQIGFVRQRAWEMDPSFPGTLLEVAGTALFAQVGFGRRLSSEQKARIQETLEQVELWEKRNELVRELSAGQQQRLYLARALACQPKLLLLDEPTSAVDAKTQSEFFKLIADLHKERDLTIILVSHDLGAVAEQVESLAVINQNLVYRGPVADADELLAQQLFPIGGRQN